jgi:uncharacterized protein with von Willebrand factor type A (vWA) domain
MSNPIVYVAGRRMTPLQVEQAVQAAAALVAAYAESEGSVSWEAVNDAHALASEAFKEPAPVSSASDLTVIKSAAAADPCPKCPKGIFCRTPTCGRLNRN